MIFFFKNAEIALAEAAPAIGHFRISLNLVLKASRGAHPFIWKWDLIPMQIKLIWLWMVVHQA